MSADHHRPDNPTQECAEVLDGLADLWDALEEGEVEEALAIGERLVDEYPESGNAHLGLAAARYEVGAVRPCMESVQRAGELGVNDPPLQQWYLAACHHYLWEFDRAREILDDILRDEPEFGEGWYLLAQVSEMQGDEIGARRGFETAVSLDPERFLRPHRIEDEEMHEAVDAATQELPPAFTKVLQEAAVIIDDLPSEELAQPQAESGDPIPPDILGLFVGSTNFDKSVFNPIDEPPRIYLFRRNLERISPNRAILVEEIRTTLWHELAHVLGFDEDQMADLGLE